MGDPPFSSFCRERAEGSSLLGFPHPAGGSQGVGSPRAPLCFLELLPRMMLAAAQGAVTSPVGVMLHGRVLPCHSKHAPSQLLYTRG